MDTSSVKYYRNINELPLCRFIDCVVDANLYALVISGKPSVPELAAAWNTIWMQYTDAIKESGTNIYTLLKKEVGNLEMIYGTLQVMIDALKDYYCEQFASAVNALLRTSFKFDVRFPDDYDNDLKRARNRSKGLLISLTLKKAALEKIVEKQDEAEALTREHFQKVLITLSDHARYPVHDSITVFEYCERIYRLNKYIEEQNRMHQKMKR